MRQAYPLGGIIRPVNGRHLQQEIGRLRRNRTRPERDLSIGGMIQSMAGSAARTNRQLGEIIDHWHTVVPSHLAGRTTITALRAGVVHVEVDSASVRFELDRFLRAGGLTRLRTACRTPLHRVRVTQRPAASRR